MPSPEILHPPIEYPSYGQVALLDPLELDQFMEYLPKLNAKGELGVITEATAYATEKASSLTFPSRAEALAAIRDLDFLTSSVLRHGEQPLDIIDGLEEELIRLGRVAQTVPRGTVFTYAAANPTCQRRRSFTGTPEEGVFIDVVTRSVVVLDGAVDGLGQVSLGNDSHLQRVLDASSDAMDEMIGSIIQVRRAITPEFFTSQMRPYFESLTIGGQTITGSGGAQMQLIAIDRMLWGCEYHDPDYENFYNENLQYLTPVQQRALGRYIQANGGRSIVGWLKDSSEASNDTRDAAISLLKKIRKFRYPHRKIAQDNFKIRPNDAVGSGSYKPDILDVLINKTEASITIIEEAKNA